jgi:quercetin 2,3-dioxygenase
MLTTGLVRDTNYLLPCQRSGAFESLPHLTGMVTIRRSEDRGHADHGWLDSRHTFSFADYFDPQYTQFHALRVLNEDRVMGGQGFGSHPHRDMEIISYVVSGALEHQDSLGTKAVMRAGDVQRISAGKGIVHSEYNASSNDPVHFLQIWIMPEERGVKPEYAEKSFRHAASGKLHLIASKGGRDNSLPIHQDADVSVARLAKGDALDHQFAPGRAGWVQLIDGSLRVDGQNLNAGDGAAISNAAQVHLEAASDAHFLFFDLN